MGFFKKASMGTILGTTSNSTFIYTKNKGTTRREKSLNCEIKEKFWNQNSVTLDKQLSQSPYFFKKRQNSTDIP